MNAANSSGGPPPPIAESLAKRSVTALDFSAVSDSSCSRLTTSARRAGRRQDAVPLRGLEVLVAHLGDGRHVGQHRQAGRGAHRDRAQPPRLDVRQQRRRAGRERLRAAGQQIGQRRPGAAVRDVRDEHAGHQLEVLHCQVAGAGVAGRAVVELAGIGLDVSDEGLEVLGRHVGVDHEQVGHPRQQRHRHEIAVHIERQVGEDHRVHGQRADVAHDDRVAIGCGLGHFLHRRHAGAAALVVDEHGLAQLARQFVGHRARHDLRGAARGERHHEADRLARPVRLRAQRAGQCQRRERGTRVASMHRHVQAPRRDQNW